MLRTLLCAVSYFTRIPVDFSRWPNATEMRASLAWLPVVGLLTGAISAGVWWGSRLLWSNSVATLLAMVAFVVLTGAMHEDGFGDACDGMGVPGPREKVLQVLKDPQMGTFGVIGILFSLGMRYTFWSALPATHWWYIPLTEAMSRVAIPLWSWLRPYARKEGPSKADYLREADSTGIPWILWGAVSSITAGSAFYLLQVQGLAGLLAAGVASALPIYVYHRKIGGVTGDVLGASQQCALWGAWLAVTAGAAL